MSSKQKLTFKVDGGLAKLAELYAATDKDAGAIDSYWQNPGALLEALAVAPAKDIRLSSGYREVADHLDRVDFEKWREDGVPAFMAGKLGDDFEQAMTVTISITVTMTMTMMMTMMTTVTVTSGYEQEKQERKPGLPGGPSFARRAEIAGMARFAQNLADQIGWFS